ncbi:hypothetical protein NQ317_015655 [Molorchus minor]|uniref:Choline/ethanolamine kinase n=1 Tax=Molorchus minor TaxID=1323400 RepID=A0ABQ9JLC8_9CUCU|nr:hypothetical protein NQ317_015655 [Molorchus minor]
MRPSMSTIKWWDFFSKQVTGDSTEMRELAARICKDYLHGVWKKVTSQDIGFKHISYPNFKRRPIQPIIPRVPPGSSVEREQLQGRAQGDTDPHLRPDPRRGRPGEALITESVIFTLLSERGLGPKLHGIFPGGRIEQYINARPLLTRELADERLTVQIAQKMATIHSMEVPLHKEPTWMWDTINRWLQTCEKKLKSNVPESVQKFLEKIDLRAETEWLKKRIDAENTPVVFCHNDMQEGNILMCLDADKENNNAEPKIVIIDFEYCSYNYRAFDVANHFIEWMYDYTEPNYPFFSEDFSKYPTEKQRLTFIRAYLDERGSRENPKKLMREVELFTMASHFFWSLWGFINADTSKIPFGYWEYACSRLSCYQQLKQKATGSVQQKRKMDDVTV